MQLQVLSNVISFNTIADHPVVAAVPDKLIQIVALYVVSAGATTVTFKDGTTARSGAISLVAGIPLELNAIYEQGVYGVPRYVTTSDANAFVIANSAAIQVSGTVWFRQF